MWATLLLGEGYHCSGKPQIKSLGLYHFFISSDKESTCRCRRCGFNPWVRKIPWRGNGNPFQYSCLENPKDRGAWQATVHGVTTVRHDLATKSPLPPTIALHPKHFQEPPPQEACPEHASPPWMIGATPPYGLHTCPYIRAFVLFQFVTACHDLSSQLDGKPSEDMNWVYQNGMVSGYGIYLINTPIK